MNIIETLTMAEIEELTALTGTDFIEVLENGVKPGRPLASLAWILEKRTNSDAKPGESRTTCRAIARGQRTRRRARTARR